MFRQPAQRCVILRRAGHDSTAKYLPAMVLKPVGGVVSAACPWHARILVQHGRRSRFGPVRLTNSL